MTHAELIKAHPTPGFEVPDCQGSVEPLWARPDRVTTGTETVEHTVVLGLCMKCGYSISVDETAGKIRNVYRAINPVSLVAAELKAAIQGGAA